MKLEKIRMATPAEVESISAKSNLNPMSRVLAMGDSLAVWKIVHELDPVVLNGGNTAKFYKFVWGIENIMRGSGVDAYHFQCPVGNKEYQKIIEEFGGERISTEPQFRYKVNL